MSESETTAVLASPLDALMHLAVSPYRHTVLGSTFLAECNRMGWALEDERLYKIAVKQFDTLREETAMERYESLRKLIVTRGPAVAEEEEKAFLLSFACNGGTNFHPMARDIIRTLTATHRQTAFAVQCVQNIGIILIATHNWKMGCPYPELRRAVAQSTRLGRVCPPFRKRFWSTETMVWYDTLLDGA